MGVFVEWRGTLNFVYDFASLSPGVSRLQIQERVDNWQFIFTTLSKQQKDLEEDVAYINYFILSHYYPNGTILNLCKEIERVSIKKLGRGENIYKKKVTKIQ